MWDEFEIHDLTNRVFTKRPEVIERGMTRAEKLFVPLLADTIRYRLEQSGQSGAFAPAIAGTLSMINRHSYLQWMTGGGEGPYVDALRTQIDAVRAALE
jgi:hypothetical protein